MKELLARVKIILRRSTNLEDTKTLSYGDLTLDLSTGKLKGVVIEGKNSVTLENVELTDTNNTLNGQSTTYKNIFLYQ